ncbi:ankyrin repeat domain-containing protein [Thiolinea disciformis]|uniref:ankyrin repeat domain-containing protein n=1 Tax=Thiolinea disciformis TaxID=125614 RepID=UPI00036D2418|nr:ankyrin repeat domain-containing protein [Thiolinea disciformis]
MNTCVSTLLIASCLLIINVCLSICVQADSTINKRSIKNRQNVELTDKQARILDANIMRSDQDCRFFYERRPSDLNITAHAIYRCFVSLRAWPTPNNRKILGLSQQQNNDKNLFDRYFINRMKLYIIGLSKVERSKFFRFIASGESENRYLIQTLIYLGLPVKETLLQQVLDGGNFASCTAYRFFLNKNLILYQQNRTLNESIPYFNDTSNISDSYRWEDLHHLTDVILYSAYCYEEIKLLAKANPKLLNNKRRIDGATPLHLYLRGTYGINSAHLEIIATLISPTNINMKSGYGDTPLHEFLSHRCLLGRAEEQVIDLLISRGANVNIRNTAGETAKTLILKHRTEGCPK